MTTWMVATLARYVLVESEDEETARRAADGMEPLLANMAGTHRHPLVKGCFVIRIRWFVTRWRSILVLRRAATVLVLVIETEITAGINRRFGGCL